MITNFLGGNIIIFYYSKIHISFKLKFYKYKKNNLPRGFETQVSMQKFIIVRKLYWLYFFHQPLTVVIFNQVYNMEGNVKSLKLLFWVLKKRFSVITGILLIDMYFILKIIEKIEIPITIVFVLIDQLLMNLKLINMES